MVQDFQPFARLTTPNTAFLAISQLSRVDGVNAVLVTNWEWDCHRRSQVQRPTPDTEPKPPLDTLSGGRTLGLVRRPTPPRPRRLGAC